MSATLQAPGNRHGIVGQEPVLVDNRERDGLEEQGLRARTVEREPDDVYGSASRTDDSGLVDAPAIVNLSTRHRLVSIKSPFGTPSPGEH